MARFNVEDFKPTVADKITLWPAGDYVVTILNAERRATKNGKEHLALTFLSESGHTYTEAVFGMVDNGKGPWVQRVTAALALAVGVSLPPIEGVDRQPWQTFDWELEEEVRAAIVGGVCWLQVDVEEGDSDGKGGTYAPKNKARFLMCEKAGADKIASFRASDAWKEVAPTIRERRAKAVAAWKTPPPPSAKGNPFSDDDLVF